MEVNVNALVFLNILDCFADVGEGFKAQKVHFEEAKTLNHNLVILSGYVVTIS